MEKPVFVDDKLREVRESGRLEYRSRALPTWCPGCGYFSIVEGVTHACNEMGLAREQSVVVSGIGCSSRFPFFVNLFGFHTLHGRVLPVATGIKTANDRLTVIAVGGDGDGFAIGGGHISHAAKRNVDITYLLFDNGIYGLTKGQTSPLSAVGLRTTTTPFDNPERPLNPLMMVLAYGASWVGQAYAGRPDHLREMITQAIAHRGFSYLHILSPCVTFDKTSKTYANLGLQVQELSPNHDPGNLIAAMQQAQDQENPAIGLYYQQFRPTLDDTFDHVIAKSGGAKV
ncbi:MAG: 2-oxoacid:ferredoxin oxidoreductase subunit beta [Magnetococcales bacterium]|nr:2-oxoacid:ferredoxin oxidoreductase subunit beta [Magnetococcales bacterium]